MIMGRFRRSSSTSRRRELSVLAYLDPVYVRNRIMYMLAANPPLDDGSTISDVADTLAIDEPVAMKRWNVAAIPERKTVACEDVEGIYIHRSFLSKQEIEDVRDLTTHVVEERAGHKRSKAVDWFEYHKGRRMFPFQPYPRVDPVLADGVLSTLESQNKKHPSTWPLLKEWRDDAGSVTASRGAGALIRLQTFLESGGLAPEAKNEPCLFIQIQHVERGSQVGAHVDDIAKGGKVIATCVIAGSNDIRVGDCVFRVEPGDVYALASHARYDVEHEVFACTEDRLSATLRFGINAAGK